MQLPKYRNLCLTKLITLHIYTCVTYCMFSSSSFFFFLLLSSSFIYCPLNFKASVAQQEELESLREENRKLKYHVDILKSSVKELQGKKP